MQADGLVRDGRALAGFFSKSSEEVPWGSIRRLTEYIRRIDSTVIRLPYTFGDSSKLKKEVHFNSDWMRMIQDNTVNILGWIQYEKVKWLQKNMQPVYDSARRQGYEIWNY